MSHIELHAKRPASLADAGLRRGHRRLRDRGTAADGGLAPSWASRRGGGRTMVRRLAASCCPSCTRRPRSPPVFHHCAESRTASRAGPGRHGPLTGLVTYTPCASSSCPTAPSCRSPTHRSRPAFLHDRGMSRTDLAEVFVAQREWAMLNPRALAPQASQRRRGAQLLAPVAYPFTRDMWLRLPDGGGSADPTSGRAGRRPPPGRAGRLLLGIRRIGRASSCRRWRP